MLILAESQSVYGYRTYFTQMWLDFVGPNHLITDYNGANRVTSTQSNAHKTESVGHRVIVHTFAHSTMVPDQWWRCYTILTIDSKGFA